MEAPAGSGKTGLLIQRLLKLLGEAEIHAPGEVLAITFTRKAAAELRSRVLHQLELAARSNAPAPADDFGQATRLLAQRVLQRDRERGWRLLASPQQLNIRTIDSFCGELARSMPLLSGGLGQRRPLDDATALYEEAAGKVLRQLGGPDAALDASLRCLLLHRDARVADCEALLAGMLAAREQWGELIPLTDEELADAYLDGHVRPRLEQTLAAVVADALHRTEQTLPAGWLDTLAELAARLSAAPPYKSAVSPLAACAGRPAAPGCRATDLEHWLLLLPLVLTGGGTLRARLSRADLGFELAATAKAELTDVVDRLREANLETNAVARLAELRCLPPATFPEEQWQVLKAIFHVLRRALAELEVLFAERGVCDFTALSLAARQLIGTETELAGGLPAAALGLQHLLVDEMQDTSVGQYRLFELLTRSWDGGSQTVFLVGDPKQSIYAFRQARVERFLRTAQSGLLGEVPLSPLYLTANFRSQAELVARFNETFAAVLVPAGGGADSHSGEVPERPQTEHPAGTGRIPPGEVPFGEVPFTAAVAVRSAGSTPALHWHARPLAGNEGDQAQAGAPRAVTALSAAERDAGQIRLLIEQFLADWNRDREPRVAVLGRNRSHLAPVIAEFQRARESGPLPFHAVEIEVLNERPEVLDLLALTRVLLHPADRVAWLAVLRSPVCGLGLADLLTLTGEGAAAARDATVAHLVEHRGHLLSAEGQALVARVWPALARAQATAGRNPLATEVERLWRTLGADAALDSSGLANARRYLALLQKLEGEAGPPSLALLERRLRQLYAESAMPGARVELMTIHKSKGLEWDLVLVPSLERSSGRNRQELLRWCELDDLPGAGIPLVLAPLAGKGERATQLWSWLGSLQTTKERAEAKRLLYVACTRAREELHLFGAADLATGGGALRQPAAGSLLQAAWPAAAPFFEAQLLQAPNSAQPNVATPLAFPAIAASEPFEQAGTPLRLAAAAEVATDSLDVHTAGQGVADTGATGQPSAMTDGEADQPEKPLRPPIQRLPAWFRPDTRFARENGPQLPYPAAPSLRHAQFLQRPEGSLAARAFGNVVHRFLELLTVRRAAGASAQLLLNELPAWLPRLQQGFRAEGLAPALCLAEAGRALRALQSTMLDGAGRWLLAPHPRAWSEQTLTVSALPTSGGDVVPLGALRADRVFVAGPTPPQELGEVLQPGRDAVGAAGDHLWIVDFKTTDPGGRDPESFLADERSRYTPQLERYARACQALTGDSSRVILALYYPLLPQLVYWPFHPEPASDTV